MKLALNSQETPRTKLTLGRIRSIESLSPPKVLRIKSAQRRKRVNCALSTVDPTVPLTYREQNPLISLQQQTLLSSGLSSAKGHTRNVHSFDFRHSAETANTKTITIQQVTPELAAQIIKQYVLPMFDSKRNSKSLSGTVYNKIKLTEQIYSELEKVRLKLDQMHEQFECQQQQIQFFKSQHSNDQKKVMQLTARVRTLKAKHKAQLKVDESFKIVLDFMQEQQDSLIETSLKNNRLRQIVDDELRHIKFEYDQAQNLNIQAQAEQMILQESIRFLAETNDRLFNVVENLAFDKKAGDLIRAEMNQVLIDNAKQIQDIAELKGLSAGLLVERDSYRNETNYLQMLKVREDVAHAILRKQMVEKVKRQDEKLRELQSELEAIQLAALTVEKERKIMHEERDKLQKHVIKLLARKGKFETSLKQCKRCNKEYNEKENFNWSCRMHQSEWGGEVWWCCGKRGKEQPGCKFSQHTSANDQEEEFKDPKEIEEERLKQLRYQRCQCCKEVGHSIEKCSKDPNYKTNMGIEEDTARLHQIVGTKKLFADTTVNTTHFLKKSVMVPIKSTLAGPEMPENENHPFMRGIMQFDDYNYSNYNDYVLIQEPEEAAKKAIINDRKRLFQTKNNTQFFHDSWYQLNQDNLDRHSNHQEYQHNALVVEPVDCQVPQVLESSTLPPPLVESIQPVPKQLKVQFQDDEEDSKDQVNEENQKQELDKSEFMARIFYNNDEIRLIKKIQQTDHFKEIVELKKEAAEDAIQLYQNKIDIGCFAPVKVVTAGMTKLKSNKFKNKRKNLYDESQKELSLDFSIQQESPVLVVDDQNDIEAVKMIEVARLNYEIEDLINHKIEKAVKSEGVPSISGDSKKSDFKKGPDNRQSSQRFDLIKQMLEEGGDRTARRKTHM